MSLFGGSGVARAQASFLHAALREDQSNEADEVLEKAGYFERNIRAIEVLIDEDVIRKGLGAQEAWKIFDRGHGYCTCDFFDQRLHRMACAQCSFYVAKQSTRAQVLEAKANLLRLRQEIPLSEPALAAVE
jgi:hypothetical protein